MAGPVNKGEQFEKLVDGSKAIWEQVKGWFGLSQKAGGGIANWSAKAVGNFGDFAVKYPQLAAIAVVASLALPVTWIYKKFKHKQELKVEEQRMHNVEDAAYIDALRYQKAALTTAPSTYEDQSIAAQRLANRQLAAMNIAPYAATNPADGNARARVSAGREPVMPGRPPSTYN